MESEAKGRASWGVRAGAVAVLVVSCGIEAVSEPVSSGGSAGDEATSPSGAGSSAGVGTLGGSRGGAGAQPPEASAAAPDAGIRLAGDAGAPLVLCQQELHAATEPATVIIVADRSGSMFDPIGAGGTSAWSALRETLLTLTRSLQAEVKFGFTAYAGDSELCPELVSVPPALDNYAAIAAVYEALDVSQRREGGPFGALDDAASVLASAAGVRQVWLVTDGVIDYCNDGNPLCPVDSTVAQLQRLSAENPPIRTTVFGQPPPISSLPALALRAFANAGASQPVTAPFPSAEVTDPNRIYDQCVGDLGWAADLSASGKRNVRGQTLAEYATSDGSAAVITPEEDVLALVARASSELIVRSCSFDLATLGVSATARDTLSEAAVVEVAGALVPHDAANGWRLVNASTLVFEGESCAALRAAADEPLATLRWECRAE